MLTIILEKLKFTADLFKENPECLELNELLLQAETALKNNEFKKALVLTESAINACRQLVGAERLKPKKAKLEKVIEFNRILPFVIATILIILGLIFYYNAKKLRFSKRKRRHKHKIGPTKKEIRSFTNEEKEIKKLLRRKK